MNKDHPTDFYFFVRCWCCGARTQSEYTEEELAGKRHNFELEKCTDNVICIDYKMAGVGSNSCGPELNKKYCVPIPKFEATFKISLI